MKIIKRTLLHKIIEEVENNKERMNGLKLSNPEVMEKYLSRKEGKYDSYYDQNGYKIIDGKIYYSTYFYENRDKYEKNIYDEFLYTAPYEIIGTKLYINGSFVHEFKLPKDFHIETYFGDRFKKVINIKVTRRINGKEPVYYIFRKKDGKFLFESEYPVVYWRGGEHQCHTRLTHTITDGGMEKEFYSVIYDGEIIKTFSKWLER